MIQLRHYKRQDTPKKKLKRVRVVQLKNIHEEKKKVDEAWDQIRRIGFFDGEPFIEKDKSWINGCWKNEPCFIVGSGGSLTDFVKDIGFNALNGKHTIAINHVIEDWDKSEWFFFLDKRFLTRTTYKMENYLGHVFAQNNTGLKPSANVDTFFCVGTKPQINIDNGLYSGNLSGLAALNLAIITGANPIYLLGFCNGKNPNFVSYHYKKDYNGEVKKPEIFKKFCRVTKYFKSFMPWKNRIINVSNYDELHPFKRMSIQEFKKVLNVIPKQNNYPDKQNISVSAIPLICHLSFSNDINVHGDVTRHIINECYGYHRLINCHTTQMKANLYIGEHFLSTDKAINEFQYKNKTIDIVHTVNCIPRGGFKKVIVLTEAWKRWLAKKGIIANIEKLNCGINTSVYSNVKYDPDLITFGRVTRWSQGKIHPQWNQMCAEILKEIPESKCIMFVDRSNTTGRPFLQHERMIYDDTLKIGNDKKDEWFDRLGVYIHANNYFKETLSVALIEAMASELPIVALSEGTGVIEEVIGNAGIICNNIFEVKQNVIELLKDKDKRLHYSALSKERAKAFNKQIMIDQMNRIIKECLR